MFPNTPQPKCKHTVSGIRSHLITVVIGHLKALGCREHETLCDTNLHIKRGNWEEMKINNILRKPITYEGTFILICLGSLYIYCNYTLERPILLTLSVIVMLLLINLFSKDLVTDKKIYENKKS